MCGLVKDWAIGPLGSTLVVALLVSVWACSPVSATNSCLCIYMQLLTVVQQVRNNLALEKIGHWGVSAGAMAHHVGGSRQARLTVASLRGFLIILCTQRGDRLWLCKYAGGAS